MKRRIALLLVLAMMFALCACGSKELTAEEREKIYQEVAQEKAAAQESGNASDTEEAASEGNSPADKEPFFEFYEARLQKASKAGYYYPDIKFKCLYDRSGLKNEPDYLFNFQFLDQDGVIVKQEDIELKDIYYGDIGWTCATSHGKHMGMEFNLDEISVVKIVSYSVFAYDNEGKKPEVSIKILLDEPVVYHVSDLEIA